MQKFKDPHSDNLGADASVHVALKKINNNGN